MKAILILDEMPETCEDCQLRNYNQCYGLPCDRTIIEEFDGEEDFKERNHICPLKPIPSKKEITVEMMWNSKYEAESLYYAGVNACLDEITGEKND